MKKLIDYLKLLGIFILYLVVSSFLLTLLYYFSNLSYKTISTIILFLVLIIFFILGYINGKSSKNKGYLAGLKIGTIFTIFLLLLNLLFIRNFKLSLLMYYALLIMSSTLGGMLGINQKKN